jgi:hypothetical protein
VQQPYGKVARARRVLGNTAGDEPRCLREVDARVQRLQEARDRVRVVLVVAVDGDDALVALVQGECIGAAQLRAELARPGLEQQAAHVE